MIRRIIGLGSLGGGDDAVGFAVCRRLRRDGVPADVEVLDCRTPDQLVWLLDGVDQALLVDAAVGRAPPGTVLPASTDHMIAADATPLSSHGLGIGQALALAASVSPDRFCKRIHLLAVVIDPRNIRGDALSPPIAAAVPRAAAEALRLLEGLPCTSRP